MVDGADWSIVLSLFDVGAVALLRWGLVIVVAAVLAQQEAVVIAVDDGALRGLRVEAALVVTTELLEDVAAVLR